MEAEDSETIEMAMSILIKVNLGDCTLKQHLHDRRPGCQDIFDLGQKSLLRIAASQSSTV
jgi:hypothetical protein